MVEIRRIGAKIQRFEDDGSFRNRMVFNSSDTVARSNVGRSRVDIIRMFLDEIWMEPGMVEIGGNQYPQAAPELWGQQFFQELSSFLIVQTR